MPSKAARRRQFKLMKADRQQKRQKERFNKFEVLKLEEEEEGSAEPPQQQDKEANFELVEQTLDFVFDLLERAIDEQDANHKTTMLDASKFLLSLAQAKLQAS